MILIYVLLLLFCSVEAGIIPGEIQKMLEISNKLCDNVNYSWKNRYLKLDFHKYTGFRVFKIYKLESSPFAFNEIVKVVYCEEGKLIWSQEEYLKESETTDMIWGTPLTVDINDDTYKFKMARKQKFVNKDTSFLLPSSLVGGIFYCSNNNCHTNNTQPVLPLYSESFKKRWINIRKGTYFSNWTFEKYIPLLSTPNDAEQSLVTLKSILYGQDIRNTQQSKDILFKLFRSDSFYNVDPSDINLDNWFEDIGIDENSVVSFDANSERYNFIKNSIQRLAEKGNDIHNAARKRIPDTRISQSVDSSSNTQRPKRNHRDQSLVYTIEE